MKFISLVSTVPATEPQVTIVMLGLIVLVGFMFWCVTRR